ncbi:MAG: hypothetical protein P4L33_18525 [Capsulimonadaceae bacterium]|nr:hypothetical protein [Capsulimonadaceae bacterium]
MFCPRCRKHWIVDRKNRRSSTQPPEACPECGVPLATDKTEAEFPAADLLAYSSHPPLTVRQVLKETSDAPYNVVSGPDADEKPADDIRRFSISNMVFAATWRLFYVDRARAGAIIGLAIMTVTSALLIDHMQTSLPPPPPTRAQIASVLQGSLGSWRGAGGLYARMQSNGAHGVATATYQNGSSRAEMWVQWTNTGKNAVQELWNPYCRETPGVLSPAGSQPIGDARVMIGKRECRVLNASESAAGKVRVIPTALIPTDQLCSVTWLDGRFLVTAAGRPADALSLAQAAIREE